MKWTMKPPIAAAALLAGAGALAADTSNLRIIVTNVKTDEGKIYVRVYDKKDDWLSDRYRTQKFVAVSGARQGDRVTMELLLPTGDYALSVFQDVNDDGKLERNVIGLPKEPAALSNNLRPKFGPPKYKDAAFTVTVGTVTEQKLKLQ